MRIYLQGTRKVSFVRMEPNLVCNLAINNIWYSIKAFLVFYQSEQREGEAAT